MFVIRNHRTGHPLLSAIDRKPFLFDREEDAKEFAASAMLGDGPDKPRRVLVVDVWNVELRQRMGRSR